MAKTVDSDTDKPSEIDPKRLLKELKRVEGAIEAKQSHCMRHVESCKPFNERIANAYEIASKASGVATKILKAKVKERDHLRKAKEIELDFEGDERETFDQVSRALGAFGDTPLGSATLRKASEADKARDEVPDSENEADLRPPHLQRNDADREATAAADNAARLADGILQLPH